MFPLITTEIIFNFFIVFSRIAAMMYTLPGLGDNRISQRIRIVSSILITICSMNFLNDLLPKYSNSIAKITYYIIAEIIVGFTIGFSIRLYFSALSVVGNLISMQSGLSSSTMFDPGQREQIMIFSSLLGNLLIIFLFTSDSYHIFISGIINSYKYFKAGQMLEFGDVASQIITVMAGSFELALQISSPFIIIGTAILVGSGVLSRLMPNFQVFFVMTPAQILILYCVLYVVINNILESVIAKMVSVLN